MNIIKCALQAGGIVIWMLVFYGERKTGEPGEKPSEQGREPTTNSTQATLVGGECSHHCAIPTSPLIPPNRA